MEETDWRKIDEKHLEAYHRRVALVETLLDEAIDEAERQQVRCRYIEEHGVSERTIRNYLRRYREQGAEALLFYKPRVPSSPRVHDRRLREKILELIEQRPSRTVPQLRRLLSADGELVEAVGQVSDRRIYRFLAETGLTQKARREKSHEAGKRSYHKFEGNQYHTEAAAGSTIEVRYTPFDLRKVWRFENGGKVETFGLKKLVDPTVWKLPEERKAADRKVSAEAAGRARPAKCGGKLSQTEGGGSALRETILTHYGFSRLPFGKDIAEENIFPTEELTRTAAMLELGIESEDVMLVSGSIGCGKSLIIRHGLAGLDTNRYQPIYLRGNISGEGELVKALLRGLKIEPPRMHSRAAIRRIATSGTRSARQNRLSFPR